ncbi:MAG: DNA translocase FtsK [Pirellulales bacterium]|nr:DNA translocase FtsK [Pirellulales bacterium]
MLEQRNLKLDLLALALLGWNIFLALALVTYDPADPPSTLVLPAHDQVHNLCGRAGHLVATALFTALGVGGYYLLISLIAFDAILLARRPIAEPWLRFVGWTLSLTGLATLAAMSLPGLSPGPVIGAGGYLGAVLEAWFRAHLATAGAYVLVISAIIGGLLLCTDYVLVRLVAIVLGRPVKQVSRGLMLARDAYERRRSSAPTIKHNGKIRLKPAEAPAAEAEEEEEAASTVRIVNPKSAAKPEPVAEEADDAEEATDDETEAAEEETAAAKPATGMASRLAAALRLRGPKSSAERQAMLAELEAASRREDDAEDYELPPISMLLEAEGVAYEEQEKDVRRKAKILEKTFADFGFQVRVVEIETGPVIAQFEVELEAGLRLSKITSLADDLAIALRVPSVRIVAPIPGKNTVGIEVPNAERQLVRLREVMEEANGRVTKMRIPIFLGKDVSGKPLVIDLTTLPHLLIAGRTGTGKSVCLNTIITSMIMTRRPDEVKMLLIDPKMVELSPYKSLPHLMHPVVTDMGKAEAILAWAVEKMEERYALLARAGVRHISSYNQLGEEELMDRLQPESDEERTQIPTNLPYIVIVADEMADLMMTAAKEVEQHIIRLAQKSRAVGIHLVLATQKPTVDVITGLIKSNLPARIAFQVASRTDSRVVLDEMGADKLLGNGDMLFLWPGTSTLLRGQGTFISDDEINRVIDFVGTSEPQFVKELVQLRPAASAEGGGMAALKSRDELYEAAVDVVVREGRGSVSLLQRALGIGYGRAARLVDFMAEDGFVGNYNGSQAREVLLTPEQWTEMQQGGAAPVPGAAAPPAPSGNRAAPAAPSAPDWMNAAPAVPRNRFKPHDEDEEAVEEEDDYEEEAAEDDAEEEAYEDGEFDEAEDAEAEEEEFDEDEVADEDVEEPPFETKAVPPPSRRKRA